MAKNTLGGPMEKCSLEMFLSSSVEYPAMGKGKNFTIGPPSVFCHCPVGPLLCCFDLTDDKIQMHMLTGMSQINTEMFIS